MENRSFFKCYHFPFLINFSWMKTLLKAWLAYNRPTLDGWSCISSVKLLNLDSTVSLFTKSYVKNIC